MTAEEAIKYLQEARQYPVAYTEQEQEAYEMAFAALRAQQKLNDPLTLAELRKMDGEPVWIKSLDDGFGEWILFQKIDVGKTCAFAAIGATRDYSIGFGKTWLAYRHKLSE